NGCSCLPDRGYIFLTDTPPCLLLAPYCLSCSTGLLWKTGLTCGYLQVYLQGWDFCLSSRWFFSASCCHFSVFFRREIFKSRYFYLSIGIASLFTLPVIVWNFFHDFVTFKHLLGLGGGNVREITLEKSLRYVGEFILSQIGISSIFLFPFFAYTLYRGFKDRKNYRVFYLWILPVFVFCCFCISPEKNMLRQTGLLLDMLLFIS
ncbi:MAG: hypothetical protein Q9M89_08720, partial [Persephonella sp.]|nr:hypothetical protein [Persephonella sp.]